MPDKRIALLIGNSHYDDRQRLAALRCPAHDVTGLGAVLEDRHIGRFESVERLPNATHVDMLLKTKQMLQEASRDDLVLFYFSGHGLTDEQGRLYLAATNTQRSILQETSFPIERLKEWCDTHRATRVIVILDCCFSGAAGLTFKSSLDDTMRMQLAKGRGKYILTATTATNPAYEKDGEEYSVFTKHLIEGLRTGVADLDQKRDGGITVDALYRYVHSKMKTERSQEPMYWDIDHKGEHLIIAWRCSQPDLPASEPGIVIQAHIDTIVQRFRLGQVVPFVGPGVLAGQPGMTPPIFAELACQLAQRANWPLAPELPLTLVAQSIQMCPDRDTLYQHVKALHRPSPPYTPAVTHRFLAQLRPALIFSTAYDTLLEEAFAAAAQDDPQRSYIIVTHPLYSARYRGRVAVWDSTRPEDLELLEPDALRLDVQRGTFIYKLHGAFDTLDKEGDELDSLVVAEEDYLALLALLEHPQTTIPNQFVRHLRRSMLLFLGYHMHDWNYRAILSMLQRKGLSERIQSYAVRHQPEAFERWYWEYKRVRLINMEVDTFLRQAIAPQLEIAL